MRAVRHSCFRVFVFGLFIMLGACGSEPAGEVAPTSGTFEALTYNVAGLPEGISGSHPEVNMPQISPLLNAYDVVLVQEDFVYHRDLVRDAEHPHQSETMTDYERLVGDGLNRFSRFPFEGHYRERWAECHGGTTGSASDCLADKGFSVATLELVSGAKVDVYNHHAEAGGGTEDNAARSIGFQQMRDYILEHSAGRAVIVAGDTNLHGFDPVDEPVLTEFIAATGLVDACRFLTCGTESIDRFLFRNSNTVELEPTFWEVAEEFVNADGGALSDHSAIHVTFNWKKL